MPLIEDFDAWEQLAEDDDWASLKTRHQPRKLQFIGLLASVSERNSKARRAVRRIAGGGAATAAKPPVEIREFWNPVENGGDRVAWLHILPQYKNYLLVIYTL